jgi:metal-responsive CopG/Arc/MetJ family transcriptional regulator
MAEIKTTISIEEELWKRFSVHVIQQEGLRKKNEVIEELIREYVAQRPRKAGNK